MANRQCPVCGNEYSDTYRKCPFCEEEAARRKGKTIRRRGGKRLDKKKRSGGAGGSPGIRKTQHHLRKNIHRLVSPFQQSIG